MQTNFDESQLADPNVALSESILRKCVHCGFCTATCPTYVTLGNELDSPRGRIYLIKDMMENDRPADEQIVTHLDRCLSCLACTTTCPSGVDYMHLIDHARVHVDKTYKRPIMDRIIRSALTAILPYPSRFGLALKFAKLGTPFIGMLRQVDSLKPIAAMLELTPKTLPNKAAKLAPKPSAPKSKVAILAGCAQSVLDPEINAATQRLLAQLNIEIVSTPHEACCGALVHHMGKEDQALTSARHMVDVWSKAIDEHSIEAIIVTASGCGTTIKDYGHMLRHDEEYKTRATKVSSIAKDITQYLSDQALPEPINKSGLRVTYHSACSMQHGQKITNEPKQLLKNAGFEVVEPREGHLCCGSAGTYNILQSDISKKLRERKLKNLKATKPDVVATGNIGCITQLANSAGVPIVHTVKLLEWAYGGEKPEGL